MELVLISERIVREVNPVPTCPTKETAIKEAIIAFSLWCIQTNFDYK